MPPPRAGTETPTNALEALERASFHTRQAGVELVAAARALLDAAALAWSGRPSEAHAALKILSRGLDELGEQLASGSGALPAPIATAVLNALDAADAVCSLAEASFSAFS